MSAPAVPKPAPPPSARPLVACGHCRGRHTVEGVRLCSRQQDARGWAARQRADATRSE